MKKEDYNSELPSLKELADIAGISDTFKDILLENMGLYDYSDAGIKGILTSLQKANGSDDLSDQVITFYKAIGYAPFIHEELLEKPLGGFFENNPGCYILHPLLQALGVQKWRGQELEYYDYLLTADIGLEPKDWSRLFRIFINPECMSDLHRESECYGALIFEGLLRNRSQATVVSSPFSIKYWLNQDIWELWKKEYLNGDNPTSICEALFGKMAVDWFEILCSTQDVSAARIFLCWLGRTRKHLLLGGKWDRMWEELRTMPVCSPPAELNEENSDDISILVTSYFHRLWKLSGGEVIEPSSMDKERLSQQIAEISLRCARNQLKLPHEIMRDLIAADLGALEFEGLDKFPLVESETLLLAGKYLALMRSEMQSDHASPVDINEYRLPLLCVVKREPGNALKQLLLTLRSSEEVCSDESLEYRPDWDEGIEGMPPGQAVCCIISKLIGHKAIKPEQLQKAFAGFCLMRIKPPKGCGRKLSKGELYESDYCIEKDPFWRRAYVQALGELGWNEKGSVHKALYTTRNHDPIEDIRDAAKASYRDVRRERIDGLDVRKSLVAAFFWLRWAQRMQLGKFVNEGTAMLTRRTELRGNISVPPQLEEYI